VLLQPRQQHAVLQEDQVRRTRRRRGGAHCVERVVGGRHPDGPLPSSARRGVQGQQDAQAQAVVQALGCWYLRIRRYRLVAAHEGGRGQMRIAQHAHHRSADPPAAPDHANRGWEGQQRHDRSICAICGP
jgi:hypothetical protein